MKKYILFIGVTSIIKLGICQSISERKEFLCSPKGQLIEECYEYFDNSGKLTKEWRKDYRGDISTSTTEFFYDGQNKLVKEVFYAQHCYLDSNKKLIWLDTSFIYTKTFEYNQMGLVSLEKEFGYECDFKTSSDVYYFYDNGRLSRKFCTHECNMGYSENKYPIHYEYDKNDSLVLEQAMGPKDTTTVWYEYKWDYLSVPQGQIYERYYRKNDTLKLEYKITSINEFDKNGKKTKTIYIGTDSPNDTVFYKYNSKGLLISKSDCRDGNGIYAKTTYKYDRKGNPILIEEYKIDRKKNKLAMRYYLKYKYETY